MKPHPRSRKTVTELEEPEDFCVKVHAECDHGEDYCVQLSTTVTTSREQSRPELAKEAVALEQAS